MMEQRAMLCVDPFSQRYPQTIGLPADELDDQAWLKVVTDAEEAREALLAAPGIREVWVVGSDNMEAINLAAALKSDTAESGVQVYLVSEDTEGELPLHAQAADLDGMLGFGMLARRYEECRLDTLPQTEPAVAPEAPRRTVVRALRQGLLVPVVSGTGGSGKSSVAVLSAVYAARQGLKTLLVDADFQFGDMADLLGMDMLSCRQDYRVHTFDEVLDGRLDPEELAGYVPFRESGAMANLTVLAALKEPQRLEECAEVFAGFLDMVQSRFDVVVVNTSSVWTEVQAVLAEKASRVVFVLDQRPAALRAASKALALCRTCGIATGSFVMALNRSCRGAVYTKMDVGCVLGAYDVREVVDGGAEVEELMAAGNPQGLFVAQNPMAMSVAALMEFLLKGEAAVGANGAEGISDIAKRWFRRLRKGAEPCPF